MTYFIKSVDGSLRLYKKYTGLMRLLQPEFRPTVTNIARALSAGRPQHIQHALSARKYELTPGLLKPFTQGAEIYQRAGRLANDLRAILKEIGGDKNFTVTLWDDYLKTNNLGGLKMPALNKLKHPGYWYWVLCRRLRKATFIYSMLTEGADHYVSASYLKYALSLRRRGKYKTNLGTLTYSQAQAYSQYCRCCNYYARCHGIAKLAESRGLSPYAIAITPLPKYHMHGSHWQVVTPTQVSKLLTQAYRIFTDSIRQAGIDMDCIRVIEPQESGTPHLHLLLFTDSRNRARVLSTLNRAFVDTAQICGTTGIHCQYAYDVDGEIGYILKTLWGKLKFDAVYADEIMAWGEEGAHRRFGITSTAHKMPSVELWDLSRQGRAQIQHHKTYSKLLRDDVKGNETRINNINDSLNLAAGAGNYADFCRAFWDATADDQTLKRDLLKSLVSPASAVGSQLRLIYQDDYLYRSKAVDLDAEAAPKVPSRLGEAVGLVLSGSS